jgi:hypothetical protein
MVAVVGAGIGAFAGLVVSWMGVHATVALFGGAAVGAVVPLMVLGKPGK